LTVAESAAILFASNVPIPADPTVMIGVGRNLVKFANLISDSGVILRLGTYRKVLGILGQKPPLDPPKGVKYVIRT